MTSAPPGPGSFCLAGQLADFPVGDVLTFLNMGLKTGALEVESKAGNVDIFLRDGEVIHAISTLRRFRLQDFLVARGILTETLAARLIARSRAENTTFLELLVSTGIVSEEEVCNFQKILCGEIAFEALRWRDGKFRFIRDRLPSETFVELRIGIQNLILEGVRRHDEAMRFEQEVHIDRDMAVTLVCATGMLEQQVVLTPAEWGVISLINGKRTLGDLLDLSPAESELTTWKILQRLQMARLILIHERDPLETENTMIAIRTGETAAMPALAELVTGRTAHQPERERPVTEEAEAERSDVRLFTSGDATSSQRIFGRRLPARLLGVSDPARAIGPFLLSNPVMTVGRANSNDLVLPDLSISKQHAQISQDARGWRVADLNSTNGTWVNGERSPQRKLKSGDELRMGIYTFRFEQDE